MTYGLESIIESMRKKNALLGNAGRAAPVATATQTPPATQASEVQRIATDTDVDATVRKNAEDINILALKILEIDAIFQLMLPALDKLQYEHNEIMRALTGAGAVEQEPPIPPAPPMPPAGV